MGRRQKLLLLIPMLALAQGGCGPACLPPCEAVFEWFGACLAPVAELQRFQAVPKAELLTVNGSVAETGEGLPADNCFEGQTTLGGYVTDGSSPTSWMKMDDGDETWVLAVQDRSITLTAEIGAVIEIKYWADTVGWELTGGELLLERAGTPALYLGRHTSPEPLDLLPSASFTTGAASCGSSDSCGDSFGHLLEVEYQGEAITAPHDEPTAAGDLTFENRGVFSSQASLVTTCYDWGGGYAAVSAHAR